MTQVDGSFNKVVIRKSSDKVIVGAAGARGPKGDRGDAASFDINQVSFSFEQQSNARGGNSNIRYDNGWKITHNLGFRPNVMVMDYGQNNIECDIEYDPSDPLNKVNLTFSESVSGHAYLS
jgi:hypothetical protein